MALVLMSSLPPVHMAMGAGYSLRSAMRLGIAVLVTLGEEGMQKDTLKWFDFFNTINTAGAIAYFNLSGCF